MIFNRPRWQVAPGMPAGSDRLVPDVCAAADPNTGAFLIVNGRPLAIGGTSWSAPVWAGICALLNEARERAGQPFLAFLNPQIYASAVGAALRDVVQGSNGAYAAAPGYDLVTGLGAPNIAGLVALLTQGPKHASTAARGRTPRRAKKKQTQDA